MATETQKRIKAERLDAFLKNEAGYIEHDFGLEMKRPSEWHFIFINHRNGKELHVYPTTMKCCIKGEKSFIYRNLEKVIKHQLLN
ncbi:MAG: hypothetical protein KAS32_00235 [Candidatus Peribacteraceae bacterium]|nr:hypothetical protein [Candidatus Peribacteraceae bacterium]